MVELYGRRYTRRDIASHAGQLAAFAGVRLATYEDGSARGVRVLEFRTGTGFRFTLLVDRALDVHECEHAGRAIGWQSPVGVRHPGLNEADGEGGLGWLRSFSGLLATCGLDHYGFMERDTAEQYHYAPRQHVAYGLHGRVNTVPARLVGYGERWDGDECFLFAEAEIHQAAMFGENLLLRRRVEARVGESAFTLHDVVRNEGFYRTPHMMLYHFNLGHPVIAEGSRYLAPVAETVWAAHAEQLATQGVGYRTLPAPQHPFVEQVWEHRMQAGADGIVPVAVVNDALGFGALLESRRAELPAHLQWQCFEAGLYAMGIEPGTNHVGGRALARERGELMALEHGEERHYTLRFAALAGADAIRAAEARIRAIGPQPDTDYPTPTGVREACRR